MLSNNAHNFSLEVTNTPKLQVLLKYQISYIDHSMIDTHSTFGAHWYSHKNSNFEKFGYK